MNKTIFITGAGGFVGLATVKHCLDQGHKVRAFELTGSPHLVELKAIAQLDKNLKVIEGDVTRESDVLAAIGDAELVVHSAALLNSIAPKAVFEKINVEGTKNVLAAARKNKVERFLLVSTSDVFGIPEPGETITETTPYRSWLEPYADTKIAACETVKQICTESGIDYTIIYPGWVYGPGDKQFFPTIIDMLKDKHVFLWHRKNQYDIDFIYIDDLVNGIVAALFSENGKNEDFLILNDQAKVNMEGLCRFLSNKLELKISVHKLPYSLMMFIAKANQWLCQKGLLKSHLLSTTDVKAFGNEFSFSADKARNLLDWQANTPENQGFEKFLAWYNQSNAK